MKKRFILVGSIILILILIVLGVVILSNKLDLPEGYRPQKGCVPDKETAISIAEAVWLPIYGESIYDLTPFVATYEPFHGCWYVSGTLPPNMFGGVPEIKIKKSDGQILYINHGE